MPHMPPPPRALRSVFRCLNYPSFVFPPVRWILQEIVNGAAIQAKIPTALVRKQEGGRISCTSGTMDCVVSVYGFSGGVAAGSGKSGGGGGGAPATLKGLASEVARVLKPGGTVLFVEKGEAKELVSGESPIVELGFVV